jgi:hypothetical protein
LCRDEATWLEIRYLDEGSVAEVKDGAGTEEATKDEEKEDEVREVGC